MKKEDRVPSQRRSRRRWQLRRGGLWLSPKELLVCPVGLSLLLLQLLASTSGMVTETTKNSKPPFGIACGSQMDSSAPTFCGAAAGDKKNMKVDSVEIYRDYSNEVGNCLEPENSYIVALLTDWFNYGCKIPNVERDDEYIRMPIEYLIDSMTKYCGVKNADAARIAVHYECVNNSADVTDSTPGPRRNDTPTIPTRSPIAISKASTSQVSTPQAAVLTSSEAFPVVILLKSTAGKGDEAAATQSSESSGLTPPQSSNMVQILASVISVIAACSVVAAALGVCSRRRLLCFAALRARKGKSVACVSDAVSTNTAAQEEEIYAEISESCIGQSTGLPRKRDEGLVRSVNNGGPCTLQSLPYCHWPSNEEPSSPVHANAHFTDRRQREDQQTMDDRQATYVSTRTNSSCQPPAPPAPPASDGNMQTAYIELLPAERLHRVIFPSDVSSYTSLAKLDDHSYDALAYASNTGAPSND